MHILIDFISPDQGTSPLRAAFDSPIEVLVADSVQQVQGVLDAVHSRAKAGHWCVGYVRYEAAPAFDPALVVHSPASGPLAWFGVFNAALPWREEATEIAKVDWHDPLRDSDARTAIDEIHRRITAGDVYQINHTARMRGRLRSGTPRALFSALQRAQPGTYAAYVDTGEQQILSVSPELFFDWCEDGQILSRPMKGTSARGATPSEDVQNAAALRASAKERAENVMIVDLIRNDLSRIAEPHSVVVPRLFHTEALPTVWSMTTDVVARTRSGTTLAQVFAALFPCGSITGAPKVEAMRTICDLEPNARGIYCGAIGVVRPGGSATFNVAIRTVEISGGREVSCGIGSGITIDAVFEQEWAEWAHKAAFVIRASAPFALSETLRIEDGVARNATAHLARLANAATHFRFPYDGEAIASALGVLASAHPTGIRRGHLLLHTDGRIEMDTSSIVPYGKLARVRLAASPLLEAHTEFVRYKTTRREHYEVFSPLEGMFDTLLWNEAGQVTEFTCGNVAIKLKGRWVTPRLACGLLPGVARARALAAGRITEHIVHIEDLLSAEGVAFISSLRGWVEVQMDKADVRRIASNHKMRSLRRA
ncbi:para-aminobenzoate synthase subunit I [Burkholderia lata]|uniref:Para-aminobenzoate synthase subunit I n=1 Tax=Burkholderia lata (strain ATCC 17760 / DSM 23089 / LMG 22485 / NCIMB 9086 / R18194 / 383) TaxID=482957 RepID=A0A6P2UJV2_BURL3|nr:para-aminobenzoate synthase subunit I [Burkholderia lata]